MHVSRATTRKRASKACRRCNSRKVKCDAATVGTPCTRCRDDGHDDCAFISSKRGTYDRWRSRSPHRHTPQASTATQSPSNIARSPLHRLPTSPTTRDTSSPFPPESNREVDGVAEGFTARQTVEGARDVSSIHVEPAPSALSSNSLAATFETFLKQKGREGEGLLGKYGIVLLGDASPLTFALKEIQPDPGHGMPSARSMPSPSSADAPATTPAVASPSHPTHLTAADLTYLQAKGALQAPNSECLGVLVDSFTRHFYPLYSIVDKAQFLQQHRARNLPWILLQSACLVGAAFCDVAVLKQAGFRTRQSARRFFYDKAKVLYDVGYETDSVVLLQSIIMLTFWGPDMKSYWNPCSWIGVAVTIAESLGIHRATVAHTQHDLKLLRRIWWTLAARDAHCAALLGRPFRINMTQCNAPMLTQDDFSSEDVHSADPARGRTQPFMLYQVEFAKLSLILRDVVSVRFNAYPSSAQVLHGMLIDWRDNLPLTLKWLDHAPASSLYGESLKVLYHYHLIVIHLAKRDGLVDDVPELMEFTTSGTAESAAQTISSTALPLMTNSLVHSLPQEVFQAFFVAGIVFFRLMQRSEARVAQLGQAALDNCQIVLNEAKDSWDSAFWGLRIFEFLLTGIKTKQTLRTTPPISNTVIPNRIYDDTVSTLNYAEFQNAIDMGSAIQNLQNAAQHQQLDTTLTSQLYDRFLDPDSFLNFPTTFDEPENNIFEVS